MLGWSVFPLMASTQPNSRIGYRASDDLDSELRPMGHCPPGASQICTGCSTRENPSQDYPRDTAAQLRARGRRASGTVMLVSSSRVLAVSTSIYGRADRKLFPVEFGA